MEITDYDRSSLMENCVFAPCLLATGWFKEINLLGGEAIAALVIMACVTVLTSPLSMLSSKSQRWLLAMVPPLNVCMIFVFFRYDRSDGLDGFLAAMILTAFGFIAAIKCMKFQELILRGSGTAFTVIFSTLIFLVVFSTGLGTDFPTSFWLSLPLSLILVVIYHLIQSRKSSKRPSGN